MLFIRKILTNNTGSAGIIALIGMVFFGIIGGAYVTLSNSGVKTSAELRDGVAAQYLAEAGAQWAVAKVKVDPNYVKNNTIPSVEKNPGTVTAGNYVVKVEVPNPAKPANKKITSQGNVNNSTRTVVLMIGPGELGVFNNTIYSKGNMSINGGEVADRIITGSIESTKLITISGGNINKDSISKDVFCQEFSDNGHNIKNSNEIKAATENKLDIDKLMQSKPVFDDFKVNGIDLKPINTRGDAKYTLNGGSYYYEGDYLMDDKSPEYIVPKGQSAIIYVNGNFQISKNIIADNITIYVNGELKVTNGALTIKDPSNYKIYAEKGVEWNSNVTVGKGLIVTRGKINLTGGASAPQTIFIAGGNIDVNINSHVGGLYANGILAMASGSTANYDNVRDVITELVPVKVTSWNNI